MSEKRRPHHDLAAIKQAFADPTKLNRTFVSRQGAASLGLGDGEVVAIVQRLTAKDFEKSMTSYADSKAWQDVYRPTIEGRTLYVKFMLDARGALLLVSFKEA